MSYNNVTGKKRGKTRGTETIAFGFNFWLVEEVAQGYLTNHGALLSKNEAALSGST